MLQHVNSSAPPPSLADLGGIFPAALTMFREDGAFDPDATVAHVDRLVAQGAEGVVLAGTSGEFISLSSDERRLLVREVAAAVGDRIPIIVGTGAFATDESIRLTRDAMDAGATAALVILPYYQRPHRAEVLEHFRAVSRATGAPLFVYNNPTNSGTDALSGDDLGLLESEGHVVGVKSTFPTVHQTYEALVATTPAFRAFHGGLNAPLEGLAAGACGWISGILNVAVPAALRLRDAVGSGDLAAARDVWARELLPIRFIYTKNLLGPINDLELYRSILRLRGIDPGFSRRPLLPLTEEQNVRLASFLEQHELI